MSFVVQITQELAADDIVRQLVDTEFAASVFVAQQGTPNQGWRVVAVDRSLYSYPAWEAGTTGHVLTPEATAVRTVAQKENLVDEQIDHADLAAAKAYTDALAESDGYRVIEITSAIVPKVLTARPPLWLDRYGAGIAQDQYVASYANGFARAETDRI